MKVPHGRLSEQFLQLGILTFDAHMPSECVPAESSHVACLVGCCLA